MSNALAYITAARKKGLSDETIKNNMLVAGWDETIIEAGLKADPTLPAPTPSQTLGASKQQPVAVVQNFTMRGLEYIIMFIAMAAAAISFGLLLHNIVNNVFGTPDAYADAVSFASATLLVAFPIFAFLFLRLKKAELREPSLWADPSRKHAVQITLIVTFLIGLFKIISYVYSLLNNLNTPGINPSYEGSNSALGDLIHTLITVGIAGGIFAYYWFDAHRQEKK